MNQKDSFAAVSSYTLRLSLFSLVIAFVVLGFKFVAYRLTNSLALYSDALESCVNVASAFAAIVAIYISAQPANERHPYGHHKAEYFSAVLGGVLIVLSAFAIFREAYLRLFDPQTFTLSWYALILNGVASVLNAGWAWILIRHGRRSRSPALVADGKHLLTDVLSSVAVLAGMVLVSLGAWTFLDVFLAMAVAINILWSGWRVMRESIGGLMDAAAPPEELETIRQIIRENSDGALEAHDLRTRHAGRFTFLEFHLVVPGHMTVEDSHAVCDCIEAALKKHLTHALITIHVEPESKAKHKGIVVL